MDADFTIIMYWSSVKIDCACKLHFLLLLREACSFHNYKRHRNKIIQLQSSLLSSDWFKMSSGMFHISLSLIGSPSTSSISSSASDSPSTLRSSSSSASPSTSSSCKGSPSTSTSSSTRLSISP